MPHGTWKTESHERLPHSNQNPLQITKGSLINQLAAKEILRLHQNRKVAEESQTIIPGTGFIQPEVYNLRD